MLLVCVCGYLQSVLRYKFLIFDTYHPDTLYCYSRKYVRIRGYCWTRKGVREQTRLGNAVIDESFKGYWLLYVPFTLALKDCFAHTVYLCVSQNSLYKQHFFPVYK